MSWEERLFRLDYPQVLHAGIVRVTQIPPDYGPPIAESHLHEVRSPHMQCIFPCRVAARRRREPQEPLKDSEQERPQAPVVVFRDGDVRTPQRCIERTPIHAAADCQAKDDADTNDNPAYLIVKSDAPYGLEALNCAVGSSLPLGIR